MASTNPTDLTEKSDFHGESIDFTKLPIEILSPVTSEQLFKQACLHANEVAFEALRQYQIDDNLYKVTSQRRLKQHTVNGHIIEIPIIVYEVISVPSIIPGSPGVPSYEDHSEGVVIHTLVFTIDQADQPKQLIYSDAYQHGALIIKPFSGEVIIHLNPEHTWNNPREIQINSVRSKLDIPYHLREKLDDNLFVFYTAMKDDQGNIVYVAQSVEYNGILLSEEDFNKISPSLNQLPLRNLIAGTIDSHNLLVARILRLSSSKQSFNVHFGSQEESLVVHHVVQPYFHPYSIVAGANAYKRYPTEEKPKISDWTVIACYKDEEGKPSKSVVLDIQTNYKNITYDAITSEGIVFEVKVNGSPRRLAMPIAWPTLDDALLESVAPGVVADKYLKIIKAYLRELKNGQRDNEILGLVIEQLGLR